MPSIENAVSFMEKIAKDDSHGYSQPNRYGNPDYDCSSLIAAALIDGGFSVSKYSTTRDLYDQLVAEGFEIIPISSDRKRGDIFLKVGSHVIMCTDSYNIVQASIDENGGIVGASPGDQTGNEISIRPYYNMGWDYHFRYSGAEPVNEVSYEVGKTYRTACNLNVRTGPGTTYRRKSHNELSSDGKAHDTDKNGSLDVGTEVTCIAINYKINGDVWVQIPSGWVAAKYEGEVYLV